MDTICMGMDQRYGLSGLVIFCTGWTITQTGCTPSLASPATAVCCSIVNSYSCSNLLRWFLHKRWVTLLWLNLLDDLSWITSNNMERWDICKFV